jgi:hypothetical protein
VSGSHILCRSQRVGIGLPNIYIYIYIYIYKVIDIIPTRSRREYKWSNEFDNILRDLRGLLVIRGLHYRFIRNVTAVVLIH